MSNIGDFIITLLDKMGIFRLFLPFILIWTISYIVIFSALKKINIENPSALASLISFAIALLSVYYLASVLFIQYFISIATLIILVIVIGFATFFFMVPSSNSGNASLLEGLLKHKGFQAVIVVLIFVTALVALSFTTTNPSIASSTVNQTQKTISTNVTNQTTLLPFDYLTSPVTIGALVLMGIATFLIYISESRIGGDSREGGRG